MHYRAFVSYSHKDRDWGEWLHRRLENYKVHRDLRGRETPVGKIPTTLRPIFRDRDDFASGESLAEATRRALDASEFLVVVCSPNSAASRYVNEEVRLFKQTGRRARVVPIIVGGDPGDSAQECFPRAVKFDVTVDGTITDVPVEVIAADARKEADGRDIAFQKVVAGLLGISLDEIRKRAARTHRRRMAVLSGVSAAMCTLAVGAAIAAWIAREQTALARAQTTIAQQQTEFARQQTGLAEKRLEWALETAGAVTAKASTFKSKFGVPVPVLSELLSEVEQLLGRLAQEGGSSRGLALREAKMLDALANGNRDIGDTTKALDQSLRAAAKLETVVFVEGAIPAMKNDLAWQYLRVGDLMRQRNNMEDAKNRFTAAKEIIDALIKAEPANPAWLDSKSAVLGRIIDVVTLQGDLRTAQILSDQDIEIQRQLRRAWPQHSPYAVSLSYALNRRGTIAQLADNTLDADGFFKEALGLLRPLAERDTTNVELAGVLAATMGNAGMTTERLGNLGEAIKLYQSSLDLHKRISNEDPLNVSKLNGVANAMDSVGYAYQRTGELAQAITFYRDVIAIRRKIVGLDPADANQKSVLTIALARLCAAAKESGDTTLALESIEEAIRLAKELEAVRTVSTFNDAVRIVHLGMLASVLDARGDAARSTSAVEEMVTLSESLYSNDTSNSLKLRGVVIARNMLSAKYRDQGRPEESLDVLQVSLARIRPQLTRLLQDTGWIEIVAILYDNLYSTHWDLNDFNEAVAAAREQVRYGTLWIEKDATNRGAQQNLATAHTSLGNASRRILAFQDAKGSHHAAIAIRTDLVRSDPGNLGYKADLAISWTRLADLHSDQNEHALALDAELKSIALSREIVATDPSNVGWQETLAWSYYGAGGDLKKLGQIAEARKAFQESLALWERLNKALPTNATWLENITKTRKRLAELSKEKALLSR